MKLSYLQQMICNKYGKRDTEGKVHCSECPLVVDKDMCMCKANSHYDNDLRCWVRDDKEVTDNAELVL